MARLAVRWLVLLGAALLVANTSAQRAGELVFAVRADGFTETYVSMSSISRFVFFQGETIRLNIEIANTTGTPQRIDTTGVPVTSAFRFVDRDRPAQSIQVALSPVGTVGRVAVFKPVRWGTAIEIESGTDVTWRATIVANGAPGKYRWTLELPDMHPSVPLRLLSNEVDYELRAVSTFADRAELLRRRMVFAFLDEDRNIERTANDLLALYPQSHEAHIILGRRYRDRGRKRDARRHFDAAIELLVKKRDHLYLNNVPPHIPEGDPVEAIRAERDDIR